MQKTFSPLVVGLLAFALGLALGLIVGSTSNQSPAPTGGVQNQNGSYDKGYQAALGSARKLLAKNFPALFQDQPVHEVNRAVLKTIDGKKLTVEFKASALDPLGDGTIVKSFTVSDGTVLERHTPRPMNEFATERDQYTQDIQMYFKEMGSSPNPTGLKMPTPPQPYTSEKISIADLKPGDIVSFSTSADLRTSDSAVADSVFTEVAPVQTATGAATNSTAGTPAQNLTGTVPPVANPVPSAAPQAAPVAK